MMLSALSCVLALCAPAVDPSGDWSLRLSTTERICWASARVTAIGSVVVVTYEDCDRSADVATGGLRSNEMVVSVGGEVLRLAIDGNHATGHVGDALVEAWREVPTSAEVTEQRPWVEPVAECVRCAVEDCEED